MWRFFTIISVYLKVLPHFSVIELLDVCDKTSAFYEAYLKSFFDKYILRYKYKSDSGSD